MKEILDDINDKEKPTEEDEMTFKYLEQSIQKITSLYLTHNYSVHLDYIEVPKLTLSKADNAFFQEILKGNVLQPERPSHKRIEYAWKQLKKFLETELKTEKTAADKASKLQYLIDHVLAEDCTIIFMWSDNRSEAYRIFQVLNDRGVNLNNGDLLRARTLELLDHPSLVETQDELAERWDTTLAYPPSSIDDFLLWYFGSYQGHRPKRSDLTDSFMATRFDEPSLSEPIAREEAGKILAEVKQLDDDFVLLSQLCNGEWPYSDEIRVTLWDMERVNSLVRELKHTNAMPLLMALQLLNPRHFVEAVASLERFVFRYKTILNVHIGRATKIYHEHAQIIRSAPDDYEVKNLRVALKELIDKHAPDTLFDPAIRRLEYSIRGGNSRIRYLLTAIEDYHKWYDEGANGTPVCKDKMRVLDIANTTLEHIYPQKFDLMDHNAELEQIKHTLGNLTILGSNENDAMGNKGFSAKREVFKNSNLRINRQIAQSETWTKAEVDQRTVLMAQIATKVFVP